MAAPSVEPSGVPGARGEWSCRARATALASPAHAAAMPGAAERHEGGKGARGAARPWEARVWAGVDDNTARARDFVGDQTARGRSVARFVPRCRFLLCPGPLAGS
eukprot:2801902-Prymnesium_polylepis.1